MGLVWDPIDFISGTMAGLNLVIVGHPFDTVKVRLQTQHLLSRGDGLKPFSGGFDCARRTVMLEGPSALYKGIKGPLLTVPALNAIIFAAYEQGIRMLHTDADAPVSLGTRMAAGAWAGLVNTVIVAPMELVKTQQQLSYSSNGEPPATQIMKKMIKSGGVKALGQGAVITTIREVPSYMAQFYFYEMGKAGFSKALYGDRHQTEKLPNYALMASGSLGVWLFA